MYDMCMVKELCKKHGQIAIYFGGDYEHFKTFISECDTWDVPAQTMWDAYYSEDKMFRDDATIGVTINTYDNSLCFGHCYLKYYQKSDYIIFNHKEFIMGHKQTVNTNDLLGFLKEV